MEVISLLTEYLQWFFGSSVVGDEAAPLITRAQPFLGVLLALFAPGAGNPACQDSQPPLCIRGQKNGLRLLPEGQERKGVQGKYSSGG